MLYTTVCVLVMLLCEVLVLTFLTEPSIVRSLLTTGCGSQKRPRTKSARQQRDQQQSPTTRLLKRNCIVARRRCGTELSPVHESTATSIHSFQDHNRLECSSQVHHIQTRYCLRFSTSCKRKCTSKFKSDDRSLIHDKFWEMGYNERKAWVAAHVKLSHVKRRRSESGTRNCTHFYTLPAQHCGDALQ